MTTSVPPAAAGRLAELERCAVRLARAAGSRILAAAGQGGFTVHFKEARPGASVNSNPVSDVDRDVERFVRAELAAEYPDHTVIGEEMGAGEGGDFAWAVDPVDGTTNFVNGLPLFASSIGVLYRGVPLAGAIWSACTHALHPGVYHARSGGPLCFDGTPLTRRAEGAWRGVAAEPGNARELGRYWDLRTLGAATVEFAFTAAGLLRLAYLARPSLWDAAAGLTLVRAAGCAALTVQEGRWVPLERFGDDPARWCQPVLIGDERAVRSAAELIAHRD
jgi:myo-inositol-1(or 4)-monophosphatase